MLRDPDHTVRMNIIEALGKLGSSAVNVLIPLLSDPSRVVRVAAAKALGETNDLHAIAPLTRALRDNNRGVQKAAQDALKKLQKT